MKVLVEFENNDHIYTVDFFKLAKELGITEEQIKNAVQELIKRS